MKNKPSRIFQPNSPKQFLTARPNVVLLLLTAVCLLVLAACVRNGNPPPRLNIVTSALTFDEVAPGGQVRFDLKVRARGGGEDDEPPIESYLEVSVYLPDTGARLIFGDFVPLEEWQEISFDVLKSVRGDQIQIEARAEAGDLIASRFTRSIELLPSATVELVDGPDEIFSGGSEKYIFKVTDNVNGEPAAFSDVQVNTYLPGERVKEIFAGFTDEDGLVTVDVPVPGRLQSGWATIDARASTFVGEARFNKMVQIKPSVGIALVGQLYRTVAVAQETATLVHVWDYVNQRPASGASVAVTQGTKKIASGSANPDGSFEIRFTPAISDLTEGDMYLEIAAETEHGETQITHRYGVNRKQSILVSTDKPIYQPGQTIHMRTIILDSVTHKPIETEAALFTLYGPRGNKLMNEKIATSAYGIATFDIDLDAQATSGDYTLAVDVDGTNSNRVVEVKPYTLPRFEIAYQSDKPFYRPGESASGTIDATYFFGKPVAGGEVIIKGLAPLSINSKETAEVFEVRGQTDADGHYAYKFTLPSTFRGRLENETTQVELEISVIDPADHVERVEEQIVLAEQDLVIEAVPESGVMQPGLENVVYIQASYPDGRPAKTEITIEPDGEQIAEPIQVETDEFGLAAVSLWQALPNAERLEKAIAVQRRRSRWIQTDRSLFIRYSTELADGSVEGGTKLLLPTRDAAVGILMRPESSELAVGQPLNLEIRVAGPPTLTQNSNVFVEVSKADQTVSIASVPVVDGLANATIDVDPTILGTVNVSARLVTAGPDHGPIAVVSDQRLVLINPAPMQVDVETDQDIYRPGDMAHVTINTQLDDQPTASMIGVSIVDESVFALGAQDPGFARTFFLLDRELLKSRYQIDGFAPFGPENSPYDQYNSHLRFATSTAQNLPALAEIQGARRTALLGLIAQDLSIVQRAEASIAPALPQPRGGTMTISAPDRVESNPLDNLLDNPALWLLGLPLLGAAIYQRRRSVGQSILLLSIITASAFVWSACGAPAPAPGGAYAGGGPAPSAYENAPPAPAPVNMADAPQGPEPLTNEEPAAKPRLRQFFPETLFWMPEIETDADGQVKLDVPIADSITTWRISVIASDKEGNLGSAQVGLRVFQDFFVDPQLPRFLSEGDELSVPVSIFNYLDEAQEISLDVAAADWFELIGEPQLRFTVAANEVTSAQIPLRVIGVGAHDFEVTATGSKMSDAILRSVEIAYNAELQTQVRSGRLRPGRVTPLTHAFRLPDETVAETVNMQVTLYPSILTEVLQGLDGLAKQPAGTFSQTSSRSYPNVLILDYLDAVGVDDQHTAALRARAERNVQRGYQRLVGYEIPNYPGGFSSYGFPAPNSLVTASALMQLTDMARVTYVDPALVDRMVARLEWEQWPDGSWSGGRYRYYNRWDNDEDRLVATAYIVWAMADAGVHNQAGLNYIQGHPILQEKLDEVDPYVLGMVANALAAYVPLGNAGPLEEKVFASLLRTAKIDSSGGRMWDTQGTTFMGSRQTNADLETTALVAYGLLRRERDVEVSTNALEYLVGKRDKNGGFFNAQTTVMALKALVLAAKQEALTGAATITMTVANGTENEQVRTLQLGKDGDAPLYAPQHFFFEGLSADEAVIEFAVEGERMVNYQVATESYLPWRTVAALEDRAGGQTKGLWLDVVYDRNEVRVNEVVDVTANLSLQLDRAPSTIVATVGIPPGFAPIQADLDALVAKRKVDFYQRSEQQIVFYLSRLNREQELTLDYRLLARIPGTVQTPPSITYDYYTPTNRDVDAPQELVVIGTVAEAVLDDRLAAAPKPKCTIC